MLSIGACLLLALPGNGPRTPAADRRSEAAAATQQPAAPVPSQTKERAAAEEAAGDREIAAATPQPAAPVPPPTEERAAADKTTGDRDIAATEPAGGAAKEEAEIVAVKASAYSYGARCNGAWAKRNAIGGRLKTGEVNSAAADWSRFPVGTRFRVVETGKLYEVDDYGSAMVGKDKVDLYMADYCQVDRWGVRKVTLEIVEWGSHRESLDILKQRTQSRSGYMGRMVKQLEAKLQSPSPRRDRDEG